MMAASGSSTGCPHIVGPGTLLTAIMKSLLEPEIFSNQLVKDHKLVCPAFR